MVLTWHIYKTDIYERVSSYSGVHAIRSVVLKLTIIFMKYQMFLSRQRNMNKSNKQNINNLDDKTNNNIDDTNDVISISCNSNADISSNLKDEDDDNDDEDYESAILQDDITDMIKWLNKKKLVNTFFGYMRHIPILYCNIPQSVPHSLTKLDLSGIYWFVNMSDCDGIYSIGQIVDMKNALEVLQCFYNANKENMAKFVKYEENIDENAHIYDINIDTLEYSFELLKILRKAYEYKKPILQC